MTDLLPLLRSENLLEKYVRLKDDFTFYQIDARLQVEDSEDEIDEDDRVHLEDIEQYCPGDTAGPEYVRRFEDYYDWTHIDEFLHHVLKNIENDTDGVSAEINQDVSNQVKNFDADDDAKDELIDETELQTEKLVATNTITHAVSPEVKERIAYCLYRLNRLSAALGINIFSMMLAHKQSVKKSRDGDTGKPERLMEFDLQAADQNGDCCGKLLNRYGKLTEARELIYKSSNGAAPSQLIEGYIKDYDMLSDILDGLGINPVDEHPEDYTYDFIKGYAKGIMVNNYTYVARAHGGYHLDVYNMLKTVPLDTIENTQIDVKIDPLSEIVKILSEYAETPTEIYDALYRKHNADILKFACEVMYAVNQSTSVICDPIDADVKIDKNGFLLDAVGNPYYAKFLGRTPGEPDKGLKPQWDRYTSGTAYFHVNGYVMLSPYYIRETATMRRAVLVFDAAEFFYYIAMDSNNMVPVILGDDYSEDSKHT